MNLEYFQCFIVLARELNFTRAAEKLYLSQQSLSHRIKSMEDFYGTPLFDRRPQLQLTYAGKQLLKAALSIHEIETNIQAEFSYIIEHDKGEIRIGIPRSRSHAFIPYVLPIFKQKYPNISFILNEEHSSKLEEYLLNNEIDIMIGISMEENLLTDKRFETIVMMDEPVYLVIADSLLQDSFPDSFPECKKTFKNGIHLLDFKNVPYMLKPQSSRVQKVICNYYAKHSIKPNILIESNDCIPLISLCLEGYVGFFIAQMPLSVLIKDKSKFNESINFFPVLDCFSFNKVILRYNKDKLLSKYLKDFISISKDIFRQYTI